MDPQTFLILVVAISVLVKALDKLIDFSSQLYKDKRDNDNSCVSEKQRIDTDKVYRIIEEKLDTSKQSFEVLQKLKRIEKLLEEIEKNTKNND